ncbi:unnamed protein product, partial [Symbiodinium necroappetens]
MAWAGNWSSGSGGYSWQGSGGWGGAGGSSGSGYGWGGQQPLTKKQKQNRRKKATKCGQERSDWRWALSKRLAEVESDLSAALQQVESLTADNSRMDAELQDARKMMAQQKAQLDMLHASSRVVVSERDSLLAKAQLTSEHINSQKQRIEELRQLAEDAQMRNAELRVLQAHHMDEQTKSAADKFKLEMEKGIVDLDRHRRLVSAMGSEITANE